MFREAFISLEEMTEGLLNSSSAGIGNIVKFVTLYFKERKNEAKKFLDQFLSLLRTAHNYYVDTGRETMAW